MAYGPYLINTAHPGSPFSGHGTELQFSNTRGGGVVGDTVSTTASGNHIEHAPWWIVQVNAITISAAITIQLYGLENAMTTNAQPAIVISRYDSAGTFISDVVDSSNGQHADGVEYGTASANQSWAVATPTSTTFNDGDWLVVKFHADAIGTMAVGTATIRYNGTSVGVDGDSLISFSDVITEYTPPVAAVPRKTPYPQLLAH